MEPVAWKALAAQPPEQYSLAQQSAHWGLLHGGVGDALPDVAQLEVLLPHELVAGVQFPGGGDRHVLGARAAARDTLVDAGAAGQVQHVVVEGKGFARLPPLLHQLGQLFVLVKDDVQIRFGESGGVVGGADHRLHGKLVKAQVQHGLDVLQKIGVFMGEGAPHVVGLVRRAGSHQLLEFGHDGLPAALTGVVHPVAVMDFLPAVQREDHVVHFLVGKVDDIVVNEHSVGGQGEAEVLSPLLFHRAGVGHQILYHLPVHQRLAAEEVHLQIVPGARVIHEKVQRLLAHLIAHHRPLPMVVALTCEAVGAV